MLSSVSVLAMPAVPGEVAAAEGLDQSAGVFYLFYDNFLPSFLLPVLFVFFFLVTSSPLGATVLDGDYSFWLKVRGFHGENM